jgi:hypothetical protein
VFDSNLDEILGRDREKTVRHGISSRLSRTSCKLITIVNNAAVDRALAMAHRLLPGRETFPRSNSMKNVSLAIPLFVVVASAGVARALTDDDTGYNMNAGGTVSDMISAEGDWFGERYVRDDSMESGVGGVVRYDNRSTDLISEESRIMYEFDSYDPFGGAVMNVYDQPQIGRQTYGYQITVSQTPESFIQGKFNAFVKTQNGIYCRKFGC